MRKNNLRLLENWKPKTRRDRVRKAVALFLMKPGAQRRSIQMAGLKAARVHVGNCSIREFDRAIRWMHKMLLLSRQLQVRAAQREMG